MMSPAPVTRGGAKSSDTSGRASEETLVLADLFGNTIQGEGPSIGRPASFIRLGGCNLSCSWCDTKFTWDAVHHDLRRELRRVPVQEVLEQVRGFGDPLIVITGGEPMLHQNQGGWDVLLRGLELMGKRVEIETNGTIAPINYTVSAVTMFNVSPKLHTGGDLEARRLRPDALRHFAELAGQDRAVFKFVASSTADLDEVETMVATYRIPKSAVWIMPEGITPEAVVEGGRVLAAPVIDRGWNLTTRLHVLLWPSEKSR